MKKILVSYHIPREGLRALDEKYELIYPQKEFFSTSEMLEIIPECDALITVFSRKLPDEIILKGADLQIISNYGVGFNNINIRLARKHGIAVSNTPEPVIEPTAEFTFALMLATMRRVAECDAALRTEANFKWGVMENLGYSLFGKTLGIVGMGNIGKAVARRAKAFGMPIVYHNRNRLKSDIEAQFSAKYLPFEELLRTADVISLHVPLNDTTFHLIGNQQLSTMKPQAFLINTARGAVLDEQALIAALQNQQIAGAGLDVFEKEPFIPQELLQMKQVVLAPHIGTGTIDTRIALSEMAAQNIIDFFSGKPQRVVN